MGHYEVDVEKIRSGEYEVRSDVDRIKLIASIVRKYVTNPCVRKKAEDIVREYNCGKDQKCQIRAVFDYVKKNVSYLEDIYMIDTYKDPCTTLKTGFGDCDDFTILLDSLLASIGFPVGARIIKQNKAFPFHHIYAIVIYPKDTLVEVVNGKVKLVGGKAIPLDPTVKGFRAGDELPYVEKRDFLFLFD